MATQTGNPGIRRLLHNGHRKGLPGYKTDQFAVPITASGAVVHWKVPGLPNNQGMKQDANKAFIKRIRVLHNGVADGSDTYTARPYVNGTGGTAMKAATALPGNVVTTTTIYDFSTDETDAKVWELLPDSDYLTIVFAVPGGSLASQIVTIIVEYLLR